MTDKNKLGTIIYIFLLAALLTGVGIAALKGEKASPENPLSSGFSALKAEPMDGGSSADAEKAAEQVTGEDNETEQEKKEDLPERETTPPPEKQEPPEEESPKQEEDKEEQKKDDKKEDEEDRDKKDDSRKSDDDGKPGDDGKKDDDKKDGGGDGDQDDDSKKDDDGKKDDKKDNDKKDDEPDNPPDDGGGDKPDPAGDDVRIVTNLASGIVTQEELPDGILQFYAYGAGADDLSVSVRVRNINEKKSTTLQSGNGTDYQFTMVLGETYQFTIYLYQPGHNTRYITRTVTYQAKRADESDPEVGEYPPFITTNIDHYQDGDVIEGNNLTMIVTVRSNPDYKVITADRISVTLNGVPVEKHGGDGNPEYDLYFEPPNVGDYKDYKIEIVAWYGVSSRYWSKTLRYHAISEEDSAGTVSIVLDATTVGLGILDEAEYEIKKGDSAADVLLKFLEEYGYEIRYDSSGGSFYIRRIYRGDMCYGAAVPQALWEAVRRDGINLNPGQHDTDSLGEHDYTMGSGWMYAVNGSYPGRSMNAYEVKNGNTIYVRFTLAYGKDIGGFDASGGGSGSYRTYCGLWINGYYQALGHDYKETDRKEATPEEDGYIEYTCSKCGDHYREVLPHSDVTPTPWPTDTPTPGPTDTPTPGPTDTPTPGPTDTPIPEPTDTPTPGPTDTPTPEPTDTPTPEPTDTPTPEPTDTPTPKPTDTPTPKPTDMPTPTPAEEPTPEPTEPPETFTPTTAPAEKAASEPNTSSTGKNRRWDRLEWKNDIRKYIERLRAALFS